MKEDALVLDLELAAPLSEMKRSPQVLGVLEADHSNDCLPGNCLPEESHLTPSHDPFLEPTCF